MINAFFNFAEGTEMSRKRELKRAIEDCELEIKSLEQKRMRSQSALLESVLMKSEPDKTEMEYFRVFSALVNKERQRLIQLNEELKNL